MAHDFFFPIGIISRSPPRPSDFPRRCGSRYLRRNSRKLTDRDLMGPESETHRKITQRDGLGISFRPGLGGPTFG